MTKIQDLSINTSNARYAARVWRTETLRHEANEQIVKMMQAFVPENFHVEIIEHQSDAPVL